MKIVVLGYIIRGPLGGMVWHHLQYVLGLKELGHTVLFLEDSDDYPSCYNPELFETNTNPVYGLTFLKNFFTRFDLQNDWAYFDAHTNQWFGWSKNKVLDFCSKADLAINLSGINPLRSWWASIPKRLFVDTDPVFMQVRHLTDSAAMQHARGHTHFATFGENFGQPKCSMPDDGLAWKPTRQPVVLRCWEPAQPVRDGRWTTVMQWDSYRNATYNGYTYRMKSGSIDPYLSVPTLLGNEIFELALGGANAPRPTLQAKGWIIGDPAKPSKTPGAFQSYITCSKGEWTIAKHGYVTTYCGWQSERTLNYLASGKPAIVQETGFSDLYPTGKGLFSFSNIDEVRIAVECVNEAYEEHCVFARKLVEEFFDSSDVLSKLLET